MKKFLIMTLGTDRENWSGVSLVDPARGKMELLGGFRNDYEADAFATGYSIASGITFLRYDDLDNKTFVSTSDTCDTPWFITGDLE